MKKILILLIFILNLGYAKGVVGLNQAFDKQTAIANAHWKAFEPILNDLIGQNAYKGSIKKSFKKNFKKISKLLKMNILISQHIVVVQVKMMDIYVKLEEI